MAGLNILCIGSVKESYLRSACGEYIKRMTPFCRVKVSEFKDCESLLDSLEGVKGCIVALCVEGISMTSEKFASFIRESQNSGKSDFYFIIGGSLGLDESVKALSSLRLSFSEMTFPHQLMRVILLEQLYRAFMINSNRTYHK